MPVVIHREDGKSEIIDSDIGGPGGRVIGGSVYHEWDCAPGLLACRDARREQEARERRTARDAREGDFTQGVRADRDGLRR